MTNNTSKLPEKSCLNCHFLVVTENSKTSMTKKERKTWMEKTCENSTSDTITGCCHFQVWDRPTYQEAGEDPEAFNGYSERDQLMMDRCNDCFFYPHTEWMSIAAAVQLERRVADRREADKDRKITKEEAHKSRTLSRWALGIAIGSIVVNVFVPFWHPSNPDEIPQNSITQPAEEKTSISSTSHAHPTASELNPNAAPPTMSDKPDAKPIKHIGKE